MNIPDQHDAAARQSLSSGDGTPSQSASNHASGTPTVSVPDHVLLRPIGRGGYGEVWLARNALNQYRAVKILRRSSFQDERPFEREFAGIQRFEPVSRTHESQLNILHVGRGPDYFYYVMELADDMARGAEIDEASYNPRSLRSELLLRGRLPTDECVRLGLALTTALVHLHRHGLVHRDVKPSNIVFVNGIPKLADIGLVAKAESTMSYVGTEGYLPPEGPGTVQADLYSLGKVLYELNTGHDRQQFPDFPTNIAELPDRRALAEFNEVIIRACAANPAERYQTAAEMHAELALLQGGRSIAQLRRVERRLQAVVRAGGALTVIALLAMGAFAYQRFQTRVARSLAEQNQALAAEKARLATQLRQSEQIARENAYAADISLAGHALSANNLQHARSLLRNLIPGSGQPDLRSFEWRYLWGQCRGQELFSLPGPTNGARRIASSPDGRRLAFGGEFASAEVWDLDTRRQLAVLPDTSKLKSIAFSPDGNLLVTAASGNVTLWDGRDFTLVRQLQDAGNLAKFSPDGNWLLTLAFPRWKLWSTDTWNWDLGFELAERWKHPDMTGDDGWFDFAPDGRVLAVMCADAIRLFRFPPSDEDFGPFALIPFTLAAGPSGRGVVKFSPDNRTLAIVGTSGFGVRLWDTVARHEMQVLAGHSDHVLGVSFSPDGSRVATCSADQTVRVWSVEDGQLLHTYSGAGGCEEVAYSPDGSRLASVDGSIVKLWDAKPESPRGFFREPSWPVGFNRQGGLVALDEELRPAVVNSATLQVTNREDVPLIAGRAVTLRLGVMYRRDPTNREPWLAPFLGNLAADGQTLALHDFWQKQTTLVDLRERQPLCSVPAVSPWVTFAPVRQLFATDTTNETTTVWDMRTGQPKWVFATAGGPFHAIAFSPDENWIVTDETTQMKLWRIDGEVVKETAAFSPKRHSCTGMAWSPDSRMLATSAGDTPIHLWSMPEAEPVGVLSGHSRGVVFVAFSPDGRTLASMSDDQTVRLWHVASRRELLRFQSPKADHGYFSLVFSPDGNSLAARRIHEDGPITWVWHAHDFTELAIAE